MFHELSASHPVDTGALSEVFYELSASHPVDTRRKQQYAIRGGTHVKISFLNENTANKRGFLGELGLSLLIEWDGGKRCV